MEFTWAKWGDKVSYKGDKGLFLSYATGVGKAYIILQGSTEAIKVDVQELSGFSEGK